LRDTFGAADLPKEQRRALLDHLQGCSRCRERLRRLQRPESLLVRKVASHLVEPSHPPKARFLNHLIRERDEAPALIASLLNQPPEQRQLLISSHKRYQTWGLTELLLDRSAEEVIRGSHPAEELARLALCVTGHLAPERYGSERIEDLRALSWARIGNTLRTRSDLEGSESAFSKAFTHLRKGTGDPYEKATCLDLKASLLRAQRHLQRAQRLQERAIAIFLEVGETHSAGRALLNLEYIFAIAGDPQKGVSPLFRAISLIDPRREPHLMLFASHNLVDNLSQAGRVEEAQDLLNKIRPLYEKLAIRSVDCRRQWVEGKIALQSGRRSEARTLLWRARDGFLADERHQEASLVTADLKSFTKGRLY
jgi:tetratricopeptide (TPR) repeat protein